MQLIINGKEKHVDNNLTITKLFSDLNLEMDQIVLELNNEILSQSQFIKTVLKDGDQLELVQFVGGG